MGPTELVIVLTMLVMVVVAVAVGRVVVPRILYIFRRNAALKDEDIRLREQERDRRYQRILDRERGDRD